jgi:hypothetical protein
MHNDHSYLIVNWLGEKIESRSLNHLVARGVSVTPWASSCFKVLHTATSPHSPNTDDPWLEDFKLEYMIYFEAFLNRGAQEIWYVISFESEIFLNRGAQDFTNRNLIKTLLDFV